MCGIWAIFGTEHCVSSICQSSWKIEHRGPDAFRVERVRGMKNAALGFFHLCVMDEMTGMQPLRVASLPNQLLCYNGEIYNYKTVEKQFGFEYETGSDGESILQLYGRGGVELAAKHLDGVFAALILDMQKHQVHLLRDTFGVRPLYKVNTDDGFLGVSSEIKALVPYVDKYYPDAIIEWFLPGHYETYDILPGGRVNLVTRKRFHSIDEIPLYKTITCDPDNNYSSVITTLLTEATRKRLMSCRRIGCLLSGGLDSSLVAALVCKLAKEEGINYPIQTFTLGTSDSPDIIAARKAAKHIGSDHHEIPFNERKGIDAINEVIYHSEMYDVITIRGSLAMYLLCKYISEKTENIVIFSGEGADEVCQGYIYFRQAPSADAADKESKRLLKNIYMYDGLRADRMTAAHGLELRVPFLDHRFVSHYLSVPRELRQPRDGCEKYLLRKSFDNGLLPSEVLWRPKEGFSDGVCSTKKSWFEILEEHLEQLISDEELKTANERFPLNPPSTKEGYYYRSVFEHYFPGRAALMPYYWMPKWTNTSNPSARALDHYDQKSHKHA